MEQTDLLCDFEGSLNTVLNNQDKSEIDKNNDLYNNSKESLENGDEEIDPLDLIENCVREGNDDLHSDNNSDVWKGSDSEDETPNFDESLLNTSTTDTTAAPPPITTTTTTTTIENTTNNMSENEVDNKEDCSNNISEKNEEEQQPTIENLGINKELENEINRLNETISAESKKDNTPLLPPPPPPQSTTTEIDEVNDEQNTSESTTVCTVIDDKKDEDSGDSGIVIQSNHDEDLSKTNDQQMDGDQKTNETTTDMAEPQTNDDQSEKTVNDESKTVEDINNEEKIQEEEDTNNKDEIQTEEVVENEEKEKTTTTTTNTTNDDSNKEKDKTVSVDGSEDEMDYQDFDPSLLCPEVSMDVDEAPVTINQTAPTDENGSVLYEPAFSTYVDEQTGAEISFDLTPEELNIRSKRFNDSQPIETTKIHCTACNTHLGSALESQTNRFVHPMLKVLICKECYDFYTSGEFEKDEDGYELYCRWCGQGGQVFCCAKCECVFCNKCIKNNLGQRKLTEVKTSDDWVCFRCNLSQISAYRIACYELFEYIRRETARAATLNDPSFLKKDHSSCCDYKRKADDSEVKQKKSQPSKKKKISEFDPDFDPAALKRDELLTQQSSSQIVLNPAVLNMNNSIQPMPNQKLTFKPQAANLVKQIPKSIVTKRPLLPFIAPHPPSNASKPAFNPVRPMGFKMTATTQPSGVKSGPRGTYFWLVSSNSGAATGTLNNSRPINVSSMISRPTITTSTMNSNMSPSTIQNTFNRNKNLTPSMIGWFEKTARASARVNSHLSYTLTQLNKAQLAAESVEELAVVHNKLQELLSGSINSLIQIRKNLRTEFIAGIKCTKFPPKKTDGQQQQPQQQTQQLQQQQQSGTQPPPLAALSNNDDDVIFVPGNSTNAQSTYPSASTVPNYNSNNDLMNVPPVINAMSSNFNSSSNSNSNSTSSITTTAVDSNSTTTSSATNNTGERPRFYLKVKSVSELQNVPAECINIPDDPLPMPLPPPRPPILAPPPPPPISTPRILLPKITSINGNTCEKNTILLSKLSEGRKPEEIIQKPKEKSFSPPLPPPALQPQPPSSKELVDNSSVPKPSNNNNNNDKSIEATKIISLIDDDDEDDLIEEEKRNKEKKEKESSSSFGTTSSPTNIIENNKKDKEHLVYNVNDKPTKEIKRMMSVEVRLKRHDISKYLKNGY